MLEKRPILAIETSQNCCGACVYFDDDKYFTMSINSKNSHAEKIFEVIDNVIKSAEVKLNEIHAIAVSSGPGSFTGLRIGMSAAKGMAVGVSLPIILVPTFEALALQLSHQLSEGTEFLITNKVNSEEVFSAKFQVKANNYIFVRDLLIMKSTDELFRAENCLIYGNANIKTNNSNGVLQITNPAPEYIAKWAKLFGDSKLIYDFDYLEPSYIKNFIAKGKNYA